MKILGIETSCDETAAAVVEDGTKILSNIVASSQEMHAKTGGIIPEQAARQQVKSITSVIDQALDTKQKKIDAIAVTVGPGLIGSLLVGVETAKTLSYLWKKPIVPINHLVGHLYANWLEGSTPEFPALGLVVSGGHTDMVLMKNHGNIKWIGGTRDDAAGEAFDKTARLLGLGYPGGPAIAAQAAKFEVRNPKPELNLFPRPLINEDNFDFSFSGLKTAVLNYINHQSSVISHRRLAAEVQEAIVDVLVTKSVKAVQKYKPKSFLLGGGVAANNRLRERFQEEFVSKKLQATFHVPAVKFCTDNASVIASAAHFNYRPVDWKKIVANPQLTITD